MKILLLFFILLSSSYSKKDFYYSFINSSGQQIKEQQKQKIKDGFDNIKNIKQLAKDGNIDEAYAQIKAFKTLNKLKILDSDIIVLYGELSLKKRTKRHVFDGSSVLEEAINSSIIHEDDLANAYMTLVELKLQSNKINEAKYFARIIINNFDNEITKAYGKIYLSKIYKHTSDYKKAIKVLYHILTSTNDVLVATVVADELFDVYIISGDKQRAYDLISKVLTKNIDYYVNDSYLALDKINKLIKAQMPEFAVEILEELLKRATKPSVIEDFKFKLANTYMLMYDRTDYYLKKAKKLYEDILNDFPKGIYAQKAKQVIDEILMRQGRISPAIMAKKYGSLESMRQKILLQELLDLKDANKYNYIVRSRRIYSKISDSIAKRFGYETMNDIFDEINISMIKNYLRTGKCFALNKSLKSSRKETLVKLIEDEETKYKFFECLIEVPYPRAFSLVKETFKRSRDSNIYLYMLRMAHALELIDEAFDFSAKVEMVNDEEVLKKEFLYRFLLILDSNDSLLLEKFFNYASINPKYIEANKNNPVIIDFYYKYYLYLEKNNNKELSFEILKKLYEKQKETKAYIYSPFVQIELSKYSKLKNNFQDSIDYLLEALNKTRRMVPNDKVRIYYDLMKEYDALGNKSQSEEFLQKCKDVKDTNESLYLKMCSEL